MKEDFQPSLDIKRKKSLEFFKKRIQLPVKVMLFSVLFFASQNKAKAQESSATPLEIDSLTMEIKNPEIKDTVSYKETQKMARAQRLWMIEYIKSPKYTERLTKEYLYWKRMGQSFDEKDFGNMPDFIKSIIDSSGNLLYQYDLYNRTISIIDIEKSISANKFPSLGEEKEAYQLENIFAESDTALVSLQDTIMIQVWVDQRLSNIQKAPWIIVEDIPSVDYDRIDGQYFGSSDTLIFRGLRLSRVIRIRNKLLDEAKTSPLHEVVHASTDGNLDLIPFSKFLLAKRANGLSDYLKNATEIHARLNVFRSELKKLFIHDALKEDFTKEHLEEYKKQLKEKKFIEQYNIPQLFKTLSEEDIIWFMNNVAGTEKIETYDVYENPNFNSRYVV